MNLKHGFYLEDRRIEPMAGLVTHAGQSVHVQPKSMEVLLQLAEAGGSVVERNEILDRVWAGRAMSDEPLTRCVSELRRALGDSRDEPGFIRTVPKRGYQLIPAVSETDPEAPEDDTGSSRTGFLGLTVGTARKLVVGLGALVVAAVLQVSIERLLEMPGDAPPSAGLTLGGQSVAVLPFVDLSENQDQAYFADGLADELLILLSSNPSLQTVARTSSFAYRDQDLPAVEIARRLAASHLVEGSVRRDADTVRVGVQLIDGATGYQVWSESIEERLGDVFAIQDRLSQQIAATLEVGMLGNQAAARRTTPEAYTLFLQAKYRARQGTRESLEDAVELLREAVIIDPDYAPAWAMLAGAYSNLSGQGFWEWSRGFEAARDAAERAIEADDDYAGGYAERAWVAHRFDGDLEVAYENVERALAIDALDVEILPEVAVLLLQTGKIDEAISVLRYSIRRSPNDPRLRFNLGTMYKYADRLDESERTFQAIQSEYPDYNGVPFQLFELSLLRGDAEQALMRAEELKDYNRLKGVAVAMYDLGRREESDDTVAELIETWGETWPGVVADVFAYRGELDAAFDWLDRDYEKYGASGWGEIRLQRWYDNLRSDPRWAALLERVGFADHDLEGLALTLDLPTGVTD